MNWQARTFLKNMVGYVLCLVLVVGIAYLADAIVAAIRPSAAVDRDIGFATTHSAAPRSGKWPKVEHDFLVDHPCCEVCGNDDRRVIQVHHVLDFHDHPELELDPTNLITLCGVGGGCRAHFWLGHCGNFRLPSNPHVREDAALMKKRYDAARKQ